MLFWAACGGCVRSTGANDFKFSLRPHLFASDGGYILDRIKKVYKFLGLHLV
jgi:hypothetical protein